MALPWTKKTRTHETFISPADFDRYSKSGYVVFMTTPTAFGTYKAVKIEVIDERTSDCKKNQGN